jgi:hypothetical protein
MIDYVFRSISSIDVALSVDALSRAAAEGTILYVFGTVFSLGLGTVLGKFLAFFFFFPAIYQLVHLIVLKAIQTAIMLAQFMFAPMFLIFMATPDTERIAIGFIKSCLEVSLWTFVWAGLFRLAVMMLAYAPRSSFWGTFIMLLGIFQIMLQVPDFIAHAQIGHSSALLSPMAALRGFDVLMKTLKEEGGKFRDYWNGKGRDNSSTNLGDLTNNNNDKKLNTPGNSGTPPSEAQQTPGPNPKVTPGAGKPVSTPGAADAKKREAQKQTRDEALGRFGDLLKSGRVGEDYSGDKAGTDLVHPDEHGVKGINHGKDVEQGSKAEAMGRAIGALAHMLETNPAAAAKLGAALGWAPSEFSGTDGKYQKRLFTQQRNKMAAQGAKAWLNGEKGNAATQVLEHMLGHLTPEEREEMLEGLSDRNLPHSPLHSNYRRNSQAVDGAGLPRNAATMAFADSPEGSRLRGTALKAAYNALAGSIGPSLASQGLTAGTLAHTAALGRAIAGSTPQRSKSANAVGVAQMGDATAATYTDEENELWVDAVEALVNQGGARDPNAAVAALRGQQAARPAAFGHGQLTPSPQRTGNLRTALDHAVAGALAMKEARIPTEALNNANLAGQVYDLASVATTPGAAAGQHGRLTPQRMQAFRTAAEAKGLDNFNVDDVADVEAMVDHLGYSFNDARNGLTYAQTIRGAGNAAPLPATPNNPTRDLPRKNIAQRVMDLGYGPSLPAIEIANLEVLDGLGRGPGQIVARQVMIGAMRSLGYAGNTQAETGAFIEQHHDNLVEEVRAVSPEIVANYIAIARDNPAAQYSIPVVTQAGALANAGAFGGRVTNAVVPLQIVIDDAAAAGHPIDAAHAAPIVARISTIGEATGMRDPVRVVDLVRTVAGGTDAASVQNVADWLDVMSTHGYVSGKILAPDIQRFSAVTDSLGAAPQRNFVDKLVQAHFDMTPAALSAPVVNIPQPGGAPAVQIRRVEIAALPAIAALKPEDIGPACDATIAYLNAPAPAGQVKTITDLHGLQNDQLFVQTLIASERIHGAQHCGQYNYTTGINPVERDYHDNLNPPANTGQYNVNVSGRQIRVGN